MSKFELGILLILLALTSAIGKEIYLPGYNRSFLIWDLFIFMYGVALILWEFYETPRRPMTIFGKE